LTKSRDGYTKQVSRHYNERFLPAIKIWKKNVKVLYCTRHTFINKLYSEKVDENVIKALVGRTRKRIYDETLRRRTIFTRKVIGRDFKGFIFRN